MLREQFRRPLLDRKLRNKFSSKTSLLLWRKLFAGVFAKITIHRSRNFSIMLCFIETLILMEIISTEIVNNLCIFILEMFFFCLREILKMVSYLGDLDGAIVTIVLKIFGTLTGHYNNFVCTKMAWKLWVACNSWIGMKSKNQ